MPKKPRAAGDVVGELLYADTATNADALYRTRFAAGDPFVTLRVGRRIIGAVPLLEVNRAKEEGRFTEVLNFTELLAGLRKTKPSAGVADVVAAVADGAGVTLLRVPDHFPAGLAQRIRDLGVRLELATGVFLPGRILKDDYETESLRKANRAAVAGFKAVEKILKASAIKKGVVYFEGKPLTSERLHFAIDVAALEHGAMNVQPSIAAAGIQAVDCHCHGHGVIRANELIVVDIFPRHTATGYFGDMTRTYLKGKATPEQRRMVNAVKKAHEIGVKGVKAGVTGAALQEAVVKWFDSQGYTTGKEGPYFTGFFHSLGHGVGLQVHEEPSVSTRGSGLDPLKAGMAITIEPALYYPAIGGCRFEDSVIVTKTGCELLAKHPYRWEIA